MFNVNIIFALLFMIALLIGRLAGDIGLIIGMTAGITLIVSEGIRTIQGRELNATIERARAMAGRGGQERQQNRDAQNGAK
jgi:hypothetical protein